MDAKLRNFKIRILRILISKKMNLDAEMSYDFLRNEIYMREFEFNSYKDILFLEMNDKYLLNDSFKIELNKYYKNNSRIDSALAESRKYEFIQFFEDISKDNYRFNLSDIIDCIKDLHWYYLPIYSNTMLTNRGYNPEVEIEQYYNHYHSLEDLYNVCMENEIQWQSSLGDINLHVKYDFYVYSNRWGHKDRYTVERTFNGWVVSSIAVQGGGDKNGKAFVTCFDQDSIAYPRNFSSIISRLWDLADSNEMDSEELQEKLNDVASYVSLIEKTINDEKPSWC